MTQPLNLATSVGTITAPALQDTHQLLDNLHQLKDVPKSVTELTENVKSVDTALKLLQRVEDREWNLLGKTIAEGSETSIHSCRQAFEQLKHEVRTWMTYSEQGNMIWKSHKKGGYFKPSQVKVISEQLQFRKLTVDNVIKYSSVRNSHVTDDVKKNIIASQTDITSAITETDKQLVVLKYEISKLKSDIDEEDEEDEPSEEKTDKLKQLEEECKAVNATRKLFDELLSKAREEAVEKAAMRQAGSHTVTFGNNNSGFQTGVINGTVSGLVFGKN